MATLEQRLDRLREERDKKYGTISSKPIEQRLDDLRSNRGTLLEKEVSAIPDIQKIREPREATSPQAREAIVRADLRTARDLFNPRETTSLYDTARRDKVTLPSDTKDTQLKKESPITPEFLGNLQKFVQQRQVPQEQPTDNFINRLQQPEVQQQWQDTRGRIDAIQDKPKGGGMRFEVGEGMTPEQQAQAQRVMTGQHLDTMSEFRPGEYIRAPREEESLLGATSPKVWWNKIKTDVNKILGHNKPALWSPPQEEVVKDILRDRMRENDLESGFGGTFFNTFLPTKAMLFNEDRVVNEVRQELMQEFQEQSPVLSVVSQFMGTTANLVVLRNLGVSRGIAPAITTKIGGIQHLNPALARYVSQGVETGVLFGIQGGLSEALRQASVNETSLSDILKESAQQARFGILVGGAGQLNTLAQRMSVAGLSVGALSALEDSIKAGEINDEIILNATLNALIASGFQAIGGTKRSGILRQKEIESLNKDMMIQRIMSNNPHMSRTKASRLADTINTLSFYSHSAYYRQAPKEFTNQFRFLPNFSKTSAQKQQQFFSSVVGKITKGETIQQAIINTSNSMGLPVIELPQRTQKEIESTIDSVIKNIKPTEDVNKLEKSPEFTTPEQIVEREILAESEVLETPRLPSAERLQLEQPTTTGPAVRLGERTDIPGETIVLPESTQRGVVTPERTPDKAPVVREETKPTETGEILDTLNPMSGLFVNYSPNEINKMTLGENITTLDKTMNKPASDEITVYRGVPKGEQKEIVPGNYITTNKQLAQDYAGTGDVISKKVKLSDVLDDKTEPLGEEYIYRPQTRVVTETPVVRETIKPTTTKTTSKETKKTPSQTFREISEKSKQKRLKEKLQREKEASKKKLQEMTEKVKKPAVDKVVPTIDDIGIRRAIKLDQKREVETQLQGFKKEGATLEDFEKLETELYKQGRYDDVVEVQLFIADNFSLSDYRKENKQIASGEKEYDLSVNKDRLLEHGRLNQKIFDLYAKTTAKAMDPEAKLTTRKIKRGVKGYYNKLANVIAVRSMNDLPTMAHELAHFLDKQHNITPRIIENKNSNVNKILQIIYLSGYPGAKKKDPMETRIKEGFAVFIENIGTSPEKIRSDVQSSSLLDYFIDKNSEGYVKEIEDLLVNVNQIYRDFYGLSDMEKEIVKMGKLEVKKEKDIYTIVDRAMKLGNKLATELYTYAWPLRSLAMKSDSALTHRDPSTWIHTKGNIYANLESNLSSAGELWLINKDGNFTKRLPYNLKSLFDEIKDPIKQEEYGVYLIHRRHHYEFKRLDKLESLMKDEELPEKIRADYKSEYNDLKNILKKDGAERKLSDDIYNKKKSEYKSFDATYDSINRAFIDWMYEHGEVSKKYRDELLDREGYAPFLRDLFDESEPINMSRHFGSGGRIKSLLSRKGSEKSIVNPLAGQAKNMLNMAEKIMWRNILKDIVLNASKSKGMVRITEKQNWTGKSVAQFSGNTGSVSFDEKKYDFVVNNDIALVMKRHLEMRDKTKLDKFARNFSNVFVKGTIGYLYPAFQFTNIQLDLFQGLAQSRQLSIPMLSGFKRYAKAISRKGETRDLWQRYTRLGALQQYGQLGAYEVSKIEKGLGDRELIKKIMKARDNTDMQKVLDFVKKSPRRFISTLRLVEHISRFAEFAEAKKRGLSDLEALEHAANITVPFHYQPGYLNQFLRRYTTFVPFFKIGTTAVSKYALSIGDKKTRKRALVTAVLPMIMAMVSLWGMKRVLSRMSKEDREKVESQLVNMSMYDVANHQFIVTKGGRVVKIRVPQHINTGGALLSMMLLEKHFNANYTSGDYANYFSQLTPGYLRLPKIIEPIWEIQTNVRLFPSPSAIEAGWTQNLPSHMRYNRFTNPLAYELGQTQLAKQLDISPIQIEHFMKSTFGRGPEKLTSHWNEGWEGVAKGLGEIFWPYGEQDTFKMMGRDWDKFYKDIVDIRGEHLTQERKLEQRKLSPSEQTEFIQLREKFVFYNTISNQASKIRSMERDLRGSEEGSPQGIVNLLDKVVNLLANDKYKEAKELYDNNKVIIRRAIIEHESNMFNTRFLEDEYPGVNIDKLLEPFRSVE